VLLVNLLAALNFANSFKIKKNIWKIKKRDQNIKKKFFYICGALSALTLSAGRLKYHPACKKMSEVLV